MQLKETLVKIWMKLKERKFKDLFKYRKEKIY